MSVILILILASLAVALFFLGVFIWAIRSGQYEDTTTPSMRVLMEEENLRPPRTPEKKHPTTGENNHERSTEVTSFK